MIYHLAADAILMLHVLFAAFVIGGLLLIFLGKYRGWYWVCNPWFRSAHAAAIAVVTLQSWAGTICPLTTLENIFRSRAGEAVYTGSFISHALEYIIYYSAPAWVFTACYTAFGALVIVSWIWVRPRPFKSKSQTRPPDNSKNFDLSQFK